jgi:acyl-CoA reductase-like NAD-dependent aldehyde dehydrogenase
VNCTNVIHPNMPFGGYKQSGMGRECGEYALDKFVFCFTPLKKFLLTFSNSYTNVKSVVVNLK